MDSDKEKWQPLIGHYPRDFSFRGKVIPILSLAFEEFKNISKGNWSLDNYEISVSVNCDESYAAVSFVPDPAHSVDGVPFEVADRGMYANGMGITFIFSLIDFRLVNKTYMR